MKITSLSQPCGDFEQGQRRTTAPNEIKTQRTSSARPRNDHARREWSGYLTARVMVKSARIRAMLRVQRRTPGQRVAKNHHVRRPLRRPRSFPLSQNLARCCTKQCNRVPKLRLFRARPPKSTHLLPPSISLTPTISKHPDELGLDCVKTRAGQEPELGGFLAVASEKSDSCISMV
jgi:hypothetical protein